MFLYSLETRVQKTLQEWKDSPRLPELMFVLGVALTLTFSIPFESVLVPAVLLSRKNKRGIWLMSSLGNAVADWSVVFAIERWGWRVVHAASAPSGEFASLIRTLQEAMKDYGDGGLFLYMSVPLPQTPALIFRSMLGPATFWTFLALLGGKLIKYGAIVYLVGKFPRRFHREKVALSSDP